jgi:hypothetical protein
MASLKQERAPELRGKVSRYFRRCSVTEEVESSSFLGVSIYVGRQSLGDRKRGWARGCASVLIGLRNLLVTIAVPSSTTTFQAIWLALVALNMPYPFKLSDSYQRKEAPY